MKWKIIFITYVSGLLSPILIINLMRLLTQLFYFDQEGYVRHLLGWWMNRLQFFSSVIIVILVFIQLFIGYSKCNNVWFWLSVSVVVVFFILLSMIIGAIGGGYQ